MWLRARIHPVRVAGGLSWHLVRSVACAITHAYSSTTPSFATSGRSACTVSTVAGMAASPCCSAVSAQFT